MKHPCLVPLLLLLSILTAPAVAQDEKIFDVMMALGSHPAFEMSNDGGFLVAASGDRRRVVSVDTKKKEARLQTVKGPLTVSLASLERMDKEALDDLTALIDRAAPFGTEEGARFVTSALLGPHLVAGEAVVTERGALNIVTSREAPTADLGEEVAALKAELENEVKDEARRRSVIEVLEGLDAEPGAPGEGADPRLLRRLVAEGWLDAHVDGTAATARVTKAVRAATDLVTTRVLEGDGIRVESWGDAVGHEVTVLRSSTGVRYVLSPPAPFYAQRTPRLELLVECEAGADPFSRDAGWTRASLVHEGVEIASCDTAGAFEADEKAWRAVYPSPRSPQANPAMLPPHVPLVGADGELIALLTPHGRLDAIDAGAEKAEAEAERFLAQAAVALPTAAYLDLIGEYLFAYVYDSPDPRYPTLIGSENVHGEIHQTVLQTLSTAAGGLCRGDCDDIAELYQAVAQRQGKLAHIINIPAHNATAWGEKVGDGWRVNVLHTGAPLVFEAAALADALEQTYGHFGMLESFDPERLDVAIRFSGENTRSRWILGWRIFEDPEYSAAMIDVQRDWHYHTYRRAIVKMEKMVAAGDQDSANYRELAGLFERTGQWDRAVEFNAKAREGSEDASLSLRMNELRALHRAERLDDFEKLARSIVAEELPKREESPAYPMIVLELAANISAVEKMVPFAEETLRDTVGRGISYQVANLSFELEDADPRLLQAPQVRQILDLIRNYAFIGIGILEERAKSGGLLADPRTAKTFHDIESWLRGIAMRTAETDPVRLSIYAVMGTFYETFLGREELERRLEAAGFPEKDIDHAARVSTVLQLDRDLSWIKTSAGFWAGRAGELFDEDRDTVDPETLKRYHAAAVAARAAAERLGLAVDPENQSVHTCALLEALVTRDEDMLRERFRHAAGLGDKRIIDATTRWIGFAARHLPGEWFDRVLAIWGEEVDHKPSWFAIAWEAATAKSRENALRAAAAGVAAHPDDAAFSEELKFMRELFGKTE